jgi:eukaryotic-like serine/threonine-protein kinase
MTPERWRTIQDILHAALERAPRERAAFLDTACATDAELRAEVESLVAAAELEGEFLDTPGADQALAASSADVVARLQVALGSDLRIERELGGGGMSRVFVAEDTKLDRRVVVKVLPPALGAALDVDRFHREVRVAASLRHPHVVPLLAAGESADGLVYFTMPFIEGESLRRRLDRDGALPIADVVRFVREVADALAYAHRRGIVHRDVKPGNVLVDGDHVVVADFGIAKALMTTVDAKAAGSSNEATGSSEGLPPSPLTRGSTIIGTPGYMSPEQARGDRNVDQRSDVYSLGCMAFEMLTGATPFASSGTNGAEPSERSPSSASALRPTLPQSVDVVIARALAVERDARFESATDFAVALEEALTPRPAPAADPANVRRSLVRRWAIGVAALALVVGVAWTASLLGRRETALPATVGAPSTSAVDSARPTIAVLPFENLGRAEDAYFADGVSDELTTRLAGLRRLRVVSRTSARNYRATKLSLREVGRELGADYLLEGTVQWVRSPTAQGRVRVRPRLVRVRDDTQLWADAFDGDLTDVFALEGTIGERVAAALDVALPGGERAGLTIRPTSSFEAYNFFLRGEAARADGDDRAHALQSIAWYDSAIARDPRFALALARRSQMHIGVYWAYYDRSERRTELARADAEAALAAVPNLPEARLALGLYYYRARRDYARALEQFTTGLTQHPENADLLAARGYVLRRMGRFREALQALEQGATLDPRSWVHWWDMAVTSLYLREYSASDQQLNRATAVNTEWAVPYADRAVLQLQWRGDRAAATRIVREAIRTVDIGQLMARLRFHAPTLVPEGLETDTVLARIDKRTFGGAAQEYFLWMANWHRMRRRRDFAFLYADSARMTLEAELQRSPGEAGLNMRLGLAHAFLGRRSEARAYAQRATELLPVSRDAIDGSELLADQALVEMLIGGHDLAITILERLVTRGGDITIPLLRTDPLWAPLEGNPRFERLVRGG